MEYQEKAAVPFDLMEKEELLPMRFFQFKIYHGEEEFILTKTSTSQRMVATWAGFGPGRGLSGSSILLCMKLATH